MTATPILVEEFTVAGRRCLLWTLNRPDQLNPLDAETVTTLRSLLTDAVEEPGLAAVVVTSAGSAFSAGGDLNGYQKLFRNRDSLIRGRPGALCRGWAEVVTETQCLRGKCSARNRSIANS